MDPARPLLGSGPMFDRIATRYDYLNRLISLGSDGGWRRAAVCALELRDGARVLDVATGTGDLAIAVARRHPTARLVGVDPSPGMLAVGQAKLVRLGLHERIEFVLGDARALPFAAESFDAACMAFGIRNVPERPRALLEIRRVLRPGSRFAVLELSDPRGGLLAPLARLHVHRVVPWIGAALGGGAEYRYLARSIAAFPAAAVFAEELGAAGFLVTAVTALGFGAVHLYVGVAGDRS